MQKLSVPVGDKGRVGIFYLDTAGDGRGNVHELIPQSDDFLRNKVLEIIAAKEKESMEENEKDQDSALAKRKAVQAVMQDKNLNAIERNKKIQDIMAGPKDDIAGRDKLVETTLCRIKLYSRAMGRILVCH
jgi:hypothetical protein